MRNNFLVASVNVVFPLLLCASHGLSAEKTHKLGPYAVGQTLDEVMRTAGGLSAVGAMGIYYKDHWTFYFNERDSVLEGIVYNANPIDSTVTYPQNENGITIGSGIKEVADQYGVPEKKLSAHTGYVLRNSELGLFYVYAVKGLWFSFVNREPYGGEDDWKVEEIMVGLKQTIESRSIGAPAYARTWTTDTDKTEILAKYSKSYGDAKDLELYDEHFQQLETAYFDYIKSMGAYRITMLKIFPQDEEVAKKLFSGCDEHSFILFFPDSVRKKSLQTVSLRHKITATKLSAVIARVDQFKTDLLFEEIKRNLPVFRKP